MGIKIKKIISNVGKLIYVLFIILLFEFSLIAINLCFNPNIHCWIRVCLLCFSPVLLLFSIFRLIHINKKSTMGEYYFPKNKKRRKQKNQIIFADNRHRYEDECLKDLCEKDLMEGASFETQLSVFKNQMLGSDTFKSFIAPASLTISTSIVIPIFLREASINQDISMMILFIFAIIYIAVFLECNSYVLRLKKRRIAILRNLINDRDNTLQQRKVYIKRCIKRKPKKQIFLP